MFFTCSLSRGEFSGFELVFFPFFNKAFTKLCDLSTSVSDRDSEFTPDI